jgi:SAM-dependent methyltransferase
MGAWIPGEPPDAVRIVREGYDRIGEGYLEWSRDAVGDDPRLRYLSRILEEVDAGSRVLDLGCGPGEPLLRTLSGRYCAVGCDLSAVQLGLARERCPATPLVQADLGRLPFREGSFDAVVALFVLLHVPADDQPAVIGRMASALRPGGRLYLSTGTGGGPGGVEQGWLGVPMYFGGVDAATTEHLVRRAGLAVESVEVLEQIEDGEPLPFVWLVASRSPGTGVERPGPPNRGVE